MKLLVALSLIIYSVSGFAQNNNFDYALENQIPIDFIKSNPKLSEDYEQSIQKLESARTWGNSTILIWTASVIPIVVAANIENNIVQNTIGGISFVAVLTSFVTGTIALRKRRQGNALKQSVIDFTNGALKRNFHGSLNLQSTSNGVGLVYTF